ncbi:dipeptide epimerase [Haliangium ochraceum]|uniref:Dipeptide epimerase n=1 Tax=Haliangium ochraceum (strain DSM 14365 / JCM 11303 / SMP-2) TaxID=502025 RepID=D0LLD5_HALO1|nr:dipeptide epimerase [Haliangium ochraceum]ACY18631.1 Mandelate racemase/muconate lactonizing protein [Haliangium ochraceum DSM 14365]
MKLNFSVHQLRLKEIFKVSRESHRTHNTIIVTLENGDYVGYGEATEFAVYGARIDAMTAALTAIGDKLASYEFDTPERMWSDFAPELAEQPFAQCALDVAAHDLWGRQQGQPLHRLWNLDIKNAPQSNYSIGINSIENTITRIQSLSDWPIFKIKLGSEHDVELIAEVRKHTSARLRVDANCGWSVAEALEKAEALRELDVEFIEQPLPRDDWQGMKELYARSPIPIMADESCATEADIERCHGHFHGVNLKLMKCGGITPARRAIQRGRELGMTVMLGCMPESSVGASAIAQLAPLLDAVDMDSIVLIENDVATGAKLESGTIVYPDAPGCGVTYHGEP